MLRNNRKEVIKLILMRLPAFCSKAEAITMNLWPQEQSVTSWTLIRLQLQVSNSDKWIMTPAYIKCNQVLQPSSSIKVWPTAMPSKVISCENLSPKLKIYVWDILVRMLCSNRIIWTRKTRLRVQNRSISVKNLAVSCRSYKNSSVTIQN